MKKLVLFTLLLSGCLAWSQIEAPQPSPAAKVEQKVGLTDVTLNYSRPSMKGRVVFGNLVPYDVMWRTGANANSVVMLCLQSLRQGHGVFIFMRTPIIGECLLTGMIPKWQL